MKKSQLIELVRRNLTGGDSPPELRGRYHEAEIALYLGMVFEKLVEDIQSQRQEISNELGYNAWVYDALTKVYEIDILKDESRERYYSELPVDISSITNNDGIRMITPLKEESTAFLPQRQTDVFLMDGLDVGLLSGLIYYSLEGRKIWYNGDVDCNWTKVRAKLILSFNEFDDEDDIKVPNGKDIELFQMTLQLIKQKLPQDNVDDSAAIQNQQ